MPSLSELPQLFGFFSYAQDDDEGRAQELRKLRDQIRDELRAQFGRSFYNFGLWQSDTPIAQGEYWQGEMTAAIARSAFFIPIITPALLANASFALELETFLHREDQLGRKDLIFPLLYTPEPCPVGNSQVSDSHVRSIIAARKNKDLQTLRFDGLSTSTAMKDAIAKFASNIVDAVRSTLPDSDVDRQKNEAEGAQTSVAHRTSTDGPVEGLNQNIFAPAKEGEAATGPDHHLREDISSPQTHGIMPDELQPTSAHDLGTKAVAAALHIAPSKTEAPIVKPRKTLLGSAMGEASTGPDHHLREDMSSPQTHGITPDELQPTSAHDFGTKAVAAALYIAPSKREAPIVKPRRTFLGSATVAIGCVAALLGLFWISPYSANFFSNAASTIAPKSAAATPEAQSEAQALFLKAFESLRSGDLQAAQQGFERGLAIDPNNATAIFYLAETMTRTGGDARALYEKVVAIDPSSEEGQKSAVRLTEIANAAISKPKQNAGASRASPAEDPCALAAGHWTNTETIGTVDAYKDHLAKFPNCPFASIATSKIDELARKQEEEKQNIATAGDKIIDIVADFKSKNDGALSGFAGVYDTQKTCATNRSLDITTMLEMMQLQVIWFEGDTMVNVRFNNPDKVMRGELSFLKNFGLAGGGAIKLYSVTYEDGNQETLGFLKNRLIIGPTITRSAGRETIHYTYAVRCSQGMAVAKGAKKVLDEYSKGN